MGYYTNYNLDIEPTEGSKEIIAELRGESENANYALTEHGESAGNLKWYEHEEDLRRFSLKHPDRVFKLHGEGEENDDIWDKYFHDGKMQECKAVITIPPFDSKQLK